VYTREFWLHEIPLLAMAERSHGPYPGTVLLYHGLKADKGTHRKELEQLARSGFLAIGVDNHGHGQRALPDLAAFMAGDTHQNFLKLVRPTVAEIPFLIERLAAMEDTGPFGLTGISMGGYVAFAAPLATKRLKAVVPILGSPLWQESTDSPHLHPDGFKDVALFAWNAGCDVNVLPGPARDFTREIGQTYVEYPESDHFMRPEDWEDGWQRTLEWFQTHLSGR
jgi:dienelactone hydrolase